MLNSVWNCFLHGSFLKPIFVDIKFNTLKIQVSDYLKPMENSVFKFSVSHFHWVKPVLTKFVLLVWMGYKIKFLKKCSHGMEFLIHPKKLFFTRLLYLDSTKDVHRSNTISFHNVDQGEACHGSDRILIPLLLSNSRV